MIGEPNMQLAEAYANKSVDEIKAALAGATLRIYSCPQPATPDKPIIRNQLLAELVLGAPAFNGDDVVAETAPAKYVGTPLWARATAADGSTIGDFSAGPGDSDIKTKEVSCSKDAPVTLTRFRIDPAVPNPKTPLNPMDKMCERDGTYQISHEKTYAWNDDFASRKTK
jgi:hypothetical protein